MFAVSGAFFQSGYSWEAYFSARELKLQPRKMNEMLVTGAWLDRLGAWVELFIKS